MATQIIENLVVEVEGEGVNIVCVHGLGGSSNTWTPLMTAMHGHRIIRIDLPGSGRSANFVGELSIEDMVGAIIKVCQQLDITKAHFVGHSMGTIVCQHLVIEHPDMVSSLALFGPLVCPPDAGRPAILARAEKAARGGAAAMQEIADAIVAGATSKETKERHPATVALVRESVMRQSPHGYAQNCRALAAAQAAPIEQISVPTLLLTGDQDGVAPGPTVRAMGERIHNSKVVVLDSCGHWPTFEKPDECRAELENFLDAIG